MSSRLDDSSIPDDALLWRRVHPKWLKKRDDNSLRVSSATFKDGRREVSVHIASLTTLETILAKYPGMSVAKITAGAARRLGHTVTPQPKEDDPSHAIICPPADRGSSKVDRDAEGMAAEAELIFIGTVPEGI